MSDNKTANHAQSPRLDKKGL